jgi:hypothetical protein
MNANPDIRLRFSYKFSDWAQATLFYNSRHVDRGDIFLLLILGLSAYYFLLSFSFWQFYGLDSNFRWGIFWLLIMFMIKLDLFSLFSLWLRDKRRGKESQRVYEFIFNNEGASYHYKDESGSMDVTQAWSQFKKMIESRKAFFLVYKSEGYWILPKQYFANSDEVNSFRSFVKTKIDESALTESDSHHMV